MFDWIRNLTKSAAEKQQEMLTAYVDGELTPAERQRFEQIMADDELLRAEMERQQLFKRAIQDLPRVAAPRNFILNPADYRAPAPQRAVQLYPALRAATALAALFLVIVFSTSLFNLSAGGAIPEAAGDIALVATDTANLSAPAGAAESVAAETTRVVEVTRIVEAQAADADDADATTADTAVEAEEVEEMAEAEAADESFLAEPTAAASAPAETDEAMADEESGGDAGAEGEAVGAAEAAAPRPVATETPAPRVQAAEPEAAAAERISATETPAGQITIADNSTTASPDIPWLSILAISLFIILLAATLIARWQKNKI